MVKRNLYCITGFNTSSVEWVRSRRFLHELLQKFWNSGA